jgi:hypothetical protein
MTPPMLPGLMMTTASPALSRSRIVPLSANIGVSTTSASPSPSRSPPANGNPRRAPSGAPP